MRFLSDEWVEAMIQAVRSVESPAGVSLRVAQELTDVDDGVSRWVIDCRDGRCAFEVGDAPADVWFRCTRSTAAALARGELSPSPAVLHGELTLGGDPRHLLAATQLLASLGPAVAAVGARLDPR